MEMKNRNTRQPRSRTKLPIIIAAVVVLLLLLVLGALLLFGNGQQPEPTEPSGSIEISQPTESTPPAVEVPVKVWDMESLPDDIVAAGMAYASSNENIPGNLLMGAGAGKGLGGSQAFKYHFVGNASNGDIYIMSPFALNDPTMVTDWSQGEMLWFWVNGTELLQTVRLEVSINGHYPVTGTTYYTIDDEGKIQEAGEIPAASTSSGSRGRIHITAGQEGWIGVPLSMYGDPKVLSSIQIIVGNTTIKAGNTLYLDEFWITKMGQVPALPKDELTYKTSDSLTCGQIWDVETPEVGTAAGDVYDTAGRLDATATVYANKGVLGSKAWGYRLLEVNGGHSQNVSVMTASMAQYGYTARGIKNSTDILWFWIDSDLSADQRLHLQLNDVSTASWKSIYTIKNVNGKPALQEIPYVPNEGEVIGVGLVPHDGKTPGLYSRLKISAGWSGWVGIPIENFCVSPDGSALEIPSGRVNRLLMRLNGPVNSMQVGDTLYFDELWLTEAGKMPDLSDEALLYGCTPVTIKETIAYGKIWGADSTTLYEGLEFGVIHDRDDRNAVTNTIAAGRGVKGGMAMAYTVQSVVATNSANIDIVPAQLDELGFRISRITNKTDIFWFWVDSGPVTDQILHLQMNDGTVFMSKEKSIYTIVDVNGVATIHEVGFYADGSQLTEGVGLVPTNGVADGAYARIKLCGSWSGWIGVPIENFCVTGTGESANVNYTGVDTIVMRGYVSSKDLLSEGDTLYFDEFWLTEAGKMPQLTNEELLYKGPEPTVLELDGMYTSSMILQQNKPWIVRGTGEAGLTVTVKLLDKNGDVAQTVEATVGESGTWEATMAAVQGGYDAYKLIITSGNSRKNVKDIVFGEVWVAGGQSNMAYNIETVDVGKTMLTPEAREALKLRLESNANASYIRCFMQSLAYLGDDARTEPSGKWLNGAVWSQVEDCSATAFLFAEALQAKLDVPVGVVVAARGGKGLSSFVDKETAQSYEDFYALLEQKGFLSSDSGDSNYLGGWYNSLVSGWKGYEVAGMLWYQGEHDQNQPEVQSLGIPALVESWSKLFNNEQTVDMLPFVPIQLAPYDSEGADAQLTGYSTVNEAMLEGLNKHIAAGNKAVAVPIYDFFITLDNIHPDHKDLVGPRAADYAYGLVYGQQDVYSGPVLKDVDFSTEGKIVLTFDNIGSGLKYIQLTEEDNLRTLPEGHSYNVADFYADKLNGFTVWTGRALVEVDAKIDANDPSRIVIEVPAGTTVLGVYYGFGVEVLSANLYNSANCPALPFRFIREDADQVDLNEPLWNLDESDDALSDTTISTGGNRNTPWFDRVKYAGLSGSNALVYGYTSHGYVSTFESGLKSAAALSANGFRTDVLVNDGDIIWFWASSDMPNAMRVQPAFNGKQLRGAAFAEGADVNEDLYVYTIVKNASGEPEMQKVYHTKFESEITGLGYVNPKKENNGTYGQLKLAPGWSGWVGIPVDMLVNGGLTEGSAITSMSFYMIMFEGTDGAVANQQANDAICFDEFWLTSAGTMPSLSDDKLLYTGPETNLILNSRYSSNMIFQQGKPWMVHGISDAGQEITVSLLSGDQTVETKSVIAAADGTWSVQMSAVSGGYTQYTVQVTGGDNTQVLRNVVFGEIWVAGGQSNMEYNISQINEDEREALKTRLQSNANAGFIRVHTESIAGTTQGEQTNVGGSWMTAGDWTSVQATSAIGMYYAELLQAKLDVPVGIVVAAKGGSSIAAWLDRDLIGQYEELYEIVSELDYLNTSSIRNRVSAYFDCSIAPWQGYAVSGILWYQGEQDRFAPEIQEYAIEALVDAWSQVFNSDGADAKLPIAAIQIAPFAGSAAAPDTGFALNTEVNALMREGIERLVAGGGTGIVIPVYDFSVVVDDIHPLNKYVVGQRVFNVIWQTLYDGAAGNEVYPGPQLTDVEFTDGKAILTFDQVIKYIQLNTADNNRTYRTDNAFLPLPEDMYADKLNGFSIYTGSEYISVEATIVDGNKVELTLPAGVTVKAVCYGYGMEILAANMYSEDNYPALPVWCDGSYSTPLWDLDGNSDILVDTTIATSGTRNPAVFEKSEGNGVVGSNALLYGYSKVVKPYTYESSFQSAAALKANGFNTDAVLNADDDIIWFWADSDIVADIRLQLQFNKAQLKGAAFAEGADVNESLYVYTIVENASGEPQMQKVYYTKYDSKITGLGYVSANAANSTTYGQLKLADGWSGWIGIPANMLRSGGPTKGSTISHMSFYMTMVENVDGTLADLGTSGQVYFDEFWLTSADTMPDLRDNKLLFVDDYAAPVWDLDNSDAKLSDTYAATGTSKNQGYVDRVTGQGLLGSNALAYGYTTTGKTTTYESGLTSAAALKANGFDTQLKVRSADNILWFWINSDLPNDARLQVVINNGQVRSILRGEAYVYTIAANADGEPEMVKLSHQSYQADVKTIGLVNGNSGNTANYAALKIAAGWSGWVGIPANMVQHGGTITAGDTIHSIKFYMSMVEGTDGTVASQTVQDAIYFDEFWLTDSDTMPNLSKESLLYEPPQAGLLWDLDESDDELTGVTVATGNRNTPSLQRVSGKGINGSNALKYSLTTIGKNTGCEIGWVDANVLSGDGFRTDLQIRANDDILWFWMDSDMSTAFRMAFMVNGQTVMGGKTDYFIYYIAEENGEPVMKQAVHSNYDTVSDPVALVNYNSTNTHRNSRIRISDGWSGWIGIPANMFDRSALTTDAPQITKLRIFMNWDDALDGGLANQKVGDSIYFDNFCITAAGKMPDVSKAELLYKEPVKELLWNMDDLEDGSSVGTVAADNNAHDAAVSVSKDNGVLGSNAMKYAITGVVSGKTGSELATVKLGDYGFKTTAKYNDQQVMWFWVDSDLSADVRLILSLDTFRTKGYDNGNPDATYHIYTIGTNADGNPEIVQVNYQHDDTNDADGVDGLSYVHYTSAANNVNALARIKVSSGWSGWVGIPLSNYWENKSGIKTLSQYCGDLDTLTLQLYKNNSLDSGTWVAGESLYLDEFWLTDEGQMPELSKEALLYSGD